MESNGHTDPNPEEVNNKIEIKPSIYKVGKIVGTDEILWAISVNVDNKLLVKDMPIIDEIKSNGNAHVGYTGEGIDIEVYNEKGFQIDSYTVAWSDLAAYAKNGWTYVIPTTDDHYRYEIKYKTQYDGTGLDDVIENDVHFGDNDSSSGISIHGESDISLSKKENGVFPFNTIQMWNEYQDTGIVPLQKILDKPSNLKDKFRFWKFIIPRDSKSPKWPKDRIRNPWARIKLVGDSTNKMEFHNMTIQYME